MKQGTLYIISAPSGAGKTSLVAALVAKMSNLEVSVSHTTRPKRPAEQDGINYYFVSQLEFERQLHEDAFLEYACVFDHYYGTSRERVFKQLQAGIDIILEIDWQGAQQIRQKIPESVGIFILPPSCEILRARLQERAQDNSDTIEKRMSLAQTELSHYAEYDYLVVNDDFDVALGDLMAIIRARRLLKKEQEQTYAALLAQCIA